MEFLYDGTGNKISIQPKSEILEIKVWDLPKLYIVSDTPYTSVTKDSSTKGTLTYIDGKVEMDAIPVKYKLQGNASVHLAKKNLNLTFYADPEYGSKQKVKFGAWYPTSKIHIKANEQEYSMCRNSVSARIFHEWMGKNLPNGAMGYVDSFPCILYYNGEWMGCYTINLPQESALFNFDEARETACEHLAYRISNVTNMSSVDSWEYRGDADVTDEMNAKFQALLDVLYDTDNLTREIVESHIDIDSLLNYLVCAQIGNTGDNVHNNQTIATWDGVKWYYIWYDLDACFGTGQGGIAVGNNGDIYTGNTIAYNQFFVKAAELYRTELAEHYAKIRSRYDIPAFVSNAFYAFQNKWGIQNIDADRVKWAEDKSTSTRDVDMIQDWLTARISWCDTYFGYTG